VQGGRPAVDGKVADRARGGWTGVARALRLLTALVLLASVLLLVVLVGRAGAGASELQAKRTGAGSVPAAPRSAVAAPGEVALEPWTGPSTPRARYQRAVLQAELVSVVLSGGPPAPEPPAGGYPRAALLATGTAPAPAPAGAERWIVPHLEQVVLRERLTVPPAEDQSGGEPGRGGSGGPQPLESKPAMLAQAPAPTADQGTQSEAMALASPAGRPVAGSTGGLALPRSGPRQIGKPEPIDLRKATAPDGQAVRSVWLGDDHDSLRNKQQVLKLLPHLREAGVTKLPVEWFPQDRSEFNPDDARAARARLATDRIAMPIRSAQIQIYDEARRLGMRVLGLQPSRRVVLGIPPDTSLFWANFYSSAEIMRRVLANLPAHNEAIATEVAQLLTDDQEAMVASLYGRSHFGYLPTTTANAHLAKDYPSVVIQLRSNDGRNPREIEHELLPLFQQFIPDGFMMRVKGPGPYDYLISFPDQPAKPLSAEAAALQTVARDKLERLVDVINQHYELLDQPPADRDPQQVEQNAQERKQLLGELVELAKQLQSLPPAPEREAPKKGSLEEDAAPAEVMVGGLATPQPVGDPARNHATETVVSQDVRSPDPDEVRSSNTDVQPGGQPSDGAHASLTLSIESVEGTWHDLVQEPPAGTPPGPSSEPAGSQAGGTVPLLDVPPLDLTGATVTPVDAINQQLPQPPAPLRPPAADRVSMDLTNAVPTREGDFDQGGATYQGTADIETAVDLDGHSELHTEGDLGTFSG